MIKAKSSITLTLVDGTLDQVIHFSDLEYHTAKHIWDKMDHIYRMCNVQMVINIERELKKLTFEKENE